MAEKKVVVLDYGSGNIHSALNALSRQGVAVELSRDPKIVLEADGVVVPGVGAFEQVITALHAIGGEKLIDKRLAGGRPVLGICVGMQIMFEGSTEHNSTTPGLGQWPGQVTALEAEVIPHMGWSPVTPGSGSILFDGLAGEYFYFVHSYAAKQDISLGRELGTPLSAPITSWAEHGEKFIAAVENGPLCATQFHPEKSGLAGGKLLKNWIETL